MIPRRGSNSILCGAAALLLATLAACGGDEVTSSTAAPPATTAAPAPTNPPTTVAPTTAAPTTAAPTTAAPTTAAPTTAAPTTAAPTTAAPTTAPPTTVAPAGGWTLTDRYPAASIQGYSGNWWGSDGPSPAAPAEGETPADGFYATELLAPWVPGTSTLHVRVRRLELCTALPETACGQSDDPTEMGQDPSWVLDLEVPLDESTAVVLGGFDCFHYEEAQTEDWVNPQNKQATGAELLDLFEAYTADYATIVAPVLEQPGELWDIQQQLAEQLAAEPQGGFRSSEALCPPDATGGVLNYVHDDAPVLLLQTITDWTDGGTLEATELMQLGGVEFADGQLTLFFYAGFYS